MNSGNSAFGSQLRRTAIRIEGSSTCGVSKMYHILQAMQNLSPEVRINS